MASLNKHNGGWRIRFVDSDGKQKSLFPGKMPRKNVQQVKVHLEAILSARSSETSVPPNTAAWIKNCSDGMRGKLFKLGLIEQPQEMGSQITLEALLDRFIESRSDIKESTRTVWKRCRRLSATKVSDAGLVHLKGLTSLTELHLKGTKVSDAGIKELQAAKAKLVGKFG